jgi:hypothetical protein
MVCFTELLEMPTNKGFLLEWDLKEFQKIDVLTENFLGSEFTIVILA